MDIAYRRIVEYRRNDRAAEVSLENAWLALNFFVTESGATPQVGLDGEGGVEIEWLVDGKSLVVNALGDGTNVVWALTADGSIPFRAEFTPRSMIGDAIVASAEDFLRELSAGVANRVRR